MGSIDALNIVLKWSYPMNGRLSEPIDPILSSRLKVAISNGYPVISRYPAVIDNYPNFIVYNSWKHICRTLKYMKFSGPEYLDKSILCGWVNGCCNLQSNPLSVFNGDFFKLGKIRETPMIYSRERFLKFSKGIWSIEIKISRVRTGREKIFVNFYKGGLNCLSLSYHEVWKFGHLKTCLETLYSHSGLSVLERDWHFYSARDLVERIMNNHSLIGPFKRDGVYLGDLASTNPFEVVSFSKGEVGNSLGFPEESVSQNIHKFSESSKEICLKRLLEEKYDLKTSEIISDYTLTFWKEREIYLKALKFLVERNSSLQSVEIMKERNWKRKRFCTDISHLLFLSGYPRLWYFDEVMPVTLICKPYLLLCERKDRNKKVFNWIKNKEENKKRLVGLRRRKKLMEKTYLPRVTPLREKINGIKDLNSFDVKNCLSADILNGINPITPGCGVDLQSKRINERVKLKMSYLEAVKKSYVDLCNLAVNEEFNKVLLDNVPKSLENCIKAQKAIKEIPPLNKPPLVDKDGWSWVKPRSNLKVRLVSAGQTILEDSESILDMLEKYEKECETTLNEISYSKKLNETEKIRLDGLASSSYLIKERKRKNDYRSKSEWTNLTPEETANKRNSGPKKHRLTKAYNKWMNRRAQEKAAARKDGVMSKTEMISIVNNQVKCYKVSKINQFRLTRWVFGGSNSWKHNKKTFFFLPEIKFEKLEQATIEDFEPERIIWIDEVKRLEILENETKEQMEEMEKRKKEKGRVGEKGEEEKIHTGNSKSSRRRRNKQIREAGGKVIIENKAKPPGMKARSLRKLASRQSREDYEQSEYGEYGDYSDTDV